MVVDANVWISAFILQDVHHGVCRSWLAERLEAEDRLVVPTLVLPEVAGAVRRRSADPRLSEKAVQAILHVPGLRLVSVDRDVGDRAARIAVDVALRGADAVYVAVAQLLSLPLVTLDAEIGERAKAIVTLVNLSS
jgi:predicted nucleic acid-binding protein